MAIAVERKCRGALLMQSFFISKEGGENMGNVCECVQAFMPLLDTEYHF